MNKQELIKKIKEMKSYMFNFRPYIEEPLVLSYIEHLDEPQKVTVPQFVADWYEKYKGNLEYNIWDWMKYTNESEKLENMKFSKWLGDFENDPVETLVKMKLYGYTVDKEPKYTVKIKGKIEENLLVYGWGIKRYFFARTYNDSSKRGEHTRKELEEDGFGWVFDCEGIEIEEVE